MRITGIRLLAGGYLLLAVAWMLATPPFQAPDEPAHYLRALTIAQGSLLGPREPLDPVGRVALAAGGWQAEEQRWIEHDRRGVRVPAALAPPYTTCVGGEADIRGSCIEATYTGDYSPLAYLLPAAAMSGTGHVTTALWLARGASLIVACGFLLVALALSGPELGWSAIGVVAAATPTVLFFTGVVNPSGLELSGNLAFLSALARLGRDGDAMPAWGWWALIVSGVVTILAWQLGPLFACADVAVLVALLGRARTRGLWRATRGRMATVVGTLLASLGLFVLWGELSGALHSTLSFTPLGAALHAGLRQFGGTMRGAIGVFGWLNVWLPDPLSQLWWALVAGLMLAAVALGGRRERAVLGITAVGALAFPVLFFAFSYRLSGFGMQGRYVLPLLALVPVASCEILRRRAGAGAGAVLAIRACLAGAAVFQVIAWFVAANYWTGAGKARLGGVAFAPLTTWAPLVLACALGATAVLAAGARAVGTG